MIVVYELVDSMSGSVTKEQGQSETKQVDRRYVIGQLDSFDDVVREMEPYTPSYVATNTGYWVRNSLSVKGIGKRWWDVTATYKTLMPSESGGGDGAQYPSFDNRQWFPGSVSWDTSGHTEHITQGDDEFPAETIPEDAADFSGAINVSGDSVQGIDVPRPAMRYSETWIIPVPNAMSCTFLTAVYKLTGTINKEPFRCFEANECLFVGARGQWSDDQPYATVTFEFEARANNPTYYPWRGAAGTFDKKGWEYVWLRYEDAVDSSSLVKRPIAAYKHRIFKEKAWDDLLIGDGTICGPRTGLAGQKPAAGGNGIG